MKEITPKRKKALQLLLIMNRRCFFLYVLISAIIRIEIINPIVHIPIILLFVFLLIAENSNFVQQTKSPLIFYFDGINILFFLWSFLIFHDVVLLSFLMVHIMVERIRKPKHIFLSEFAVIFIGIALISIIKFDFAQGNSILMFSDIFIKSMCLLLSGYAGKLIVDLRDEDIEHVKKCKDRIKSKNKLLSTLSHELRTPLTMIKSSSEILLEERPGKTNETQKEFLKTIQNNTIRLIKLSETILAGIKIETTWLKLNLIPLDIRPTVRDVVERMHPLITREDKTINYSYPKLISKALADSNWLSQIMINLIQNSSKNIGPKGKIDITIKENDRNIVVSVSDNGDGIEDRFKGDVFNEFFTEENRITGGNEGVGMGLAIVKHVIEKHKGKVYVGSIAGMGTTFSFTLRKAERSSL